MQTKCRLTTDISVNKHGESVVSCPTLNVSVHGFRLHSHKNPNKEESEVCIKA